MPRQRQKVPKVPKGRSGSPNLAPASRQAVGSSAFAAGQVKRQVTPEGEYSRSTVPFTLRSTISFITTVPNPRRCGGDTGGPSRSVQLIVKVSPSVPQRTSRPPISFESAPYFPALVVSS